jgi:2-polyprenyl-3-methyl-5-hydroxy-6-metoxy-1,4-benzoquinol methylase
MENKVKKNIFGFYELDDKPSSDELNTYYTNKYYQTVKHVQKEYSDTEVRHGNFKILQRYTIIKELLPQISTPYRLLDIGCGEGWTMSFFKKQGWDVQGVDFSDYGCQAHNKNLLPYVKTGDLYQVLPTLVGATEPFHCIWLDNVLEHVLNPLGLLKLCSQLLDKDGVLFVDVPNDFSKIQEYLLQTKHISKPFWIAIPDHISYFNQEGLLAICEAARLSCVDFMTDYPIDLNLFNPLTNYVDNPETGKSCHLARVEIENFLYSISIDDMTALYRSMAKLGLGRSFQAFFKIQH